MQNLKKKQVHLDFVSPSIGSFAPNGRWSGDKAAGLLTYPIYDAPNRNVSYFVHMTSIFRQQLFYF